VYINTKLYSKYLGITTLDTLLSECEWLNRCDGEEEDGWEEYDLLNGGVSNISMDSFVEDCSILLDGEFNQWGVKKKLVNKILQRD
jgi:hypothetical protein